MNEFHQIKIIGLTSTIGPIFVLMAIVVATPYGTDLPNRPNGFVLTL